MRKSLDDLYMVIDDEEKKKSRQDPLGTAGAVLQKVLETLNEGGLQPGTGGFGL